MAETWGCVTSFSIPPISLRCSFIIFLGVWSTASEAAIPCPEGCVCQQDTIDCSHAQKLEITSSSDIQYSHLHIRNNPNFQISSGKRTQEFLRSLEQLVISRSSRKSVLSLLSFSSSGSLRSLDITENAITSSDLENLNFQEAFRSLEDLNLSRNAIRALDFTYLPSSLKLLDASQNQIRSISVPTEHSTQQLQKNLKYLNLAHNQELSDFQLVSKFENLQHLNISGTALFELPNLHLPELHSLDLSNTPKLQILTEGDLDFLPKIEELVISNTGLQKIGPWTFSKLTSLKSLTISHNQRLSSFNDTAFSHGINLELLDLSFNNLNEVPYGISRIRVKYLSLRGNPLLCDCHSLWLKQWMIQDEQKRDLVFLYSRETICANIPPSVEGPITLFEGLRRTLCQKVTIYNVTVDKNPVKLGTSARLSCNITGFPIPTITWVTPRNLVFHWHPRDIPRLHLPYPSHPIAHDRFGDRLLLKSDSDHSRHEILSNGDLRIGPVTKDDTGFYRCFVSNSVSQNVSTAELLLDASKIRVLWWESFVFGWGVAAICLIVTLLVEGIQVIIYRYGCCCPAVPPRVKRVRQALFNIEQYRAQQMEWIREGYNWQVQRVKDNCVAQLEKIRDSYTNQMKNVKALKTYGTSHLVQMRDSYYDQCKRVREYSSLQLSKARDNYVGRRKRVRKYTAAQLERLRETYKLHHKTLNKIMENIPSMDYLEGCRKGDEALEVIRLKNFCLDVENGGVKLEEDDEEDIPPIEDPLWEMYLSQIPKQIFRLDEIEEESELQQKGHVSEGDDAEEDSSSEYFTPENSPEKKKRKTDTEKSRKKEHQRRGTLGSIRSFWSTNSSSNDSLQQVEEEPRGAFGKWYRRRSMRNKGTQVQVNADVSSPSFGKNIDNEKKIRMQ
ncbi:unnamed protein product [Cyprideis torosa]|uniref:Uncharacterized protein n=1 Tax=Cyprideis torosa TaxID=163714 RepID=A0A7R8ZSH5_9CRUS|nr:unnamed protein product [Cyprideis torosa]CAG0895543.1 unnamed protein product [Cyprideis torosa]